MKTRDRDLNPAAEADSLAVASDIQTRFGFDQPDESWLATVRSSEQRGAAQRLGPYELLEVIGRGGQGLVYKARQPRTGRVVALKRLSAGIFATADMRARFEREVEIAATLDHPNIVTVYGSEMIDEQPVLTMQWIDGAPLDRWAWPLGGRRRPLHDLLGLFATVCSAIEHAHERGVIHRDLKPSNILVDGQDQPHVVDFGLAKTHVDSVLSSGESLTQTGQFVGTPAFAAPEQLRGDWRQVGIRTDVYSLGLVLHRMILGRTAFPQYENLSQILAAMERESLDLVCTPGSEVNRELAAILQRALRFDPADRYPTVGEFGADVRRFLAGETVAAHPPSRMYRLRKFVRRNRWSVAAGSAFALLLLASTAVSSALYLRAERNAQVAREEAAQSRAVTEMIQGWLAGANPRKVRSDEVKVKDLLESAARQVAAGEFRPDIERALRRALGESFQGLGLFEPAEAQFRAGLDLIGSAGQESDESIVLQKGLAETVYSQGRVEEAWPLLDRAYYMALRQWGPADMNTLVIADTRAMLMHARGEFDGAENLLREVLAGKERAVGRDHPSVGETLSSLTVVLKSRGKLDEAEACIRRAVAIAAPHADTDPAELLLDRYNLASVLADAGKYQEAEAMIRPLIGEYQQFFGADHPDCGTLLNALAHALLMQGQVDEARVTFQQALEISRRTLGPDHPRTAMAMHNTAHALADGGDLHGSIQMMEQSLALRRRILPASHPELAWTLYDLGWKYVEGRRAVEAESLFREALQVFENQPDDANRSTALGAVLSGLGNCLLEQHRPPEAIGYFERACEIRGRIGPESWPRQNSRRLLGLAYLRSGDAARAAPLITESCAALLANPQTTADVRRSAEESMAELRAAQSQPLNTRDPGQGGD